MEITEKRIGEMKGEFANWLAGHLSKQNKFLDRKERSVYEGQVLQPRHSIRVIGAADQRMPKRDGQSWAKVETKSCELGEVREKRGDGLLGCPTR
jgi:hypothetical protein